MVSSPELQDSSPSFSKPWGKSSHHLPAPHPADPRGAPVSLDPGRWGDAGVHCALGSRSGGGGRTGPPIGDDGNAELRARGAPGVDRVPPRVPGSPAALRRPVFSVARGSRDRAVPQEVRSRQDRQLLVERQQVSEVRSRAGAQRPLTADHGPAESRQPVRPAASSPSTSAPRFVTGGRVCAAVFWRRLRKFHILPGAAPDGWFRVPGHLSLRVVGPRGGAALPAPAPQARGEPVGGAGLASAVPGLGEAQPPRLPRGRPAR